MPQPAQPPLEGLTDEQLANKLWYRRDALSYDLERWQREIEAVEADRSSPPEHFERDVVLKVLGALHEFERRRGMEMLEIATNRLGEEGGVSPELRKAIQATHEVADALLGLGQKARAASRAERPAEHVAERGADVVSLVEYSRRLGLHVA